MTVDGVDPAGIDTIVLIHGMWMIAASWDRWIQRYRARGYRVLAPGWPGMDARIAELRRGPPEIAGLGVTEIADHYDRLVRQLGGAPVIIGHSVGGLIVQLLLDRGLGAAGVTIDGAPAKGPVSLTVPMLRSGFLALRNPAGQPKAVPLTPRQFHRALTNTLSRPEAAAVYEQYHVPGPARTIRQVSFANLDPHAVTQVDFGRDGRAPLLLIAGGKDHIFPATVARSSFKRYRRSQAVTAYKEFPERSHYTIGEPGWEQVADYVLRWALENAYPTT